MHVTDTAHTGPVWSSGWNIPGYLPDDEPMSFTTWEEAHAALADALDQAIYATDEGSDEDREYRHVETLLKQAEAGQRFSEKAGNYVWWIEHVHLPERR